MKPDFAFAYEGVSQKSMNSYDKSAAMRKLAAAL